MSLTKRNFLKGAMGTLAAATIGSVPAIVRAAPGDVVLVKNVRVYSGKGDTLSELTNVLIKGELIETIAPNADAPADAAVFDGGGRTLMPGLIDTHTHLQWNQGPGQYLGERSGYVAALTLRECEATLMRGFTSVRDVAGGVWGAAKAVDEGLFPGPRIQLAGAALSISGGHGDYRSRSISPRQLGGPNRTEFESHGITIFADGVPEVLTAVREQFRQGSHFIKLFSGGAVSGMYDPLDITEYSPDETRAAVEEAARWNTYVASHAYTDQSIRAAVEAGVKSIEHGNLLQRKTIELMAERGTWLSTQTGVYMTEFPEGFSDAQRGRQRVVRDALDNMMTVAKDVGVKISLGTDLIGSPEAKATQLEEFENRTQWFTNAEILQQATGNNGELMALAGPRNPYQAGPLGVIEEGAYADLLMVNGNPLEDITVMSDADKYFDLIMKGGKTYKNAL